MMTYLDAKILSLKTSKAYTEARLTYAFMKAHPEQGYTPEQVLAAKQEASATRKAYDDARYEVRRAADAMRAAVK